MQRKKNSLELSLTADCEMLEARSKGMGISRICRHAKDKFMLL